MSLCLGFTGKYNKWDKVDPAELFSQAPTEKKEANPKLNMVKFLQVRGAAGQKQAGSPFPWLPPAQPLGGPLSPLRERPQLAHQAPFGPAPPSPLPHYAASPQNSFKVAWWWWFFLF